ncbi:MAG: diguanylate cyclase [Ruminococcus sp.]|nr:diguanylate cyclase [Ruminococcus sp.]
MSDIYKKTVTVRQLRNRMIIFYCAAMLLTALIVCTYVFVNIQRIGMDKSAAHDEALALRLAESVDSFCDHAETDCTQVFKHPEIMDYDPFINNYPEYESTRLEFFVRDELLNLAAGRSYNDYFIFYSDPHNEEKRMTVGKISTSADDFIVNGSLERLESLLGDSNDVWLFSPSGASRKIYYFRRINDHAVFVLSCYIDELEPFVLAGSLNENSEITVALTDRDGKVILTDMPTEKSGIVLSRDFSERFESMNETVTATNFIGTTVSARCGWRIYVVSRDILGVSEHSTILGILSVIVVLVMCVCILVGFAATARIAGAEIERPENEFIDPISGRLNEYGLDEKISDRIETSLVGSTYAFIIIGIKDYDTIRQTVSLTFRRAMVERLVAISEGFFAERRFLIGRISGDRLVMFVDFSEFDLFRSHGKLEKECTALSKEFTDFTADSESSLKLGVNIGVCVYPDHGEDYDTLFAKADEAFSEAESRPESCSVIYKAPWEQSSGSRKGSKSSDEGKEAAKK